MAVSDRGQRSLAAVVAALLAAGFYILFKVAAEENSRAVVILAMLLCAAVLNSATSLVVGTNGKALRPIALIAAVVLGVFTVLGNFGAASALAIQEPAVTVTVIHTQLLFVAVLEFVFLRHPITRRFAAGAVIAVGGFAVMQLAGSSLGAVSVVGVLWALLASISFAVMHVFTRAVIDRIDPVSINAFRLWIAVAALLFLPGNARELSELSLEGWALAAGAAFFGPFLSRLCIMASVKFIAASEASLLTMSTPLFAFVLGYLVFGTTPLGHEIVGGLIIMAGVLVPMWPKDWQRRQGR